MCTATPSCYMFASTSKFCKHWALKHCAHNMLHLVSSECMTTLQQSHAAVCAQWAVKQFKWACVLTDETMLHAKVRCGTRASAPTRAFSAVMAFCTATSTAWSGSTSLCSRHFSSSGTCNKTRSGKGCAKIQVNESIIFNIVLMCCTCLEYIEKGCYTAYRVHDSNTNRCNKLQLLHWQESTANAADWQNCTRWKQTPLRWLLDSVWCIS
jgi:hypothetical protein